MFQDFYFYHAITPLFFLCIVHKIVDLKNLTKKREVHIMGNIAAYTINIGKKCIFLYAE